MIEENENTDRRKFLKFGLLAGGVTLATGLGLKSGILGKDSESTGKKVKLLTADGQLVEVDSSHIKHHIAESKITALQAREGIEGKKFVMVIDLARCANARKCVEGCQTMHHKH